MERKQPIAEVVEFFHQLVATQQSALVTLNAHSHRAIVGISKGTVAFVHYRGKRGEEALRSLLAEYDGASVEVQYVQVPPPNGSIAPTEQLLQMMTDALAAPSSKGLNGLHTQAAKELQEVLQDDISTLSPAARKALLGLAVEYVGPIVELLYGDLSVPGKSVAETIQLIEQEIDNRAKAADFVAESRRLLASLH